MIHHRQQVHRALVHQGAQHVHRGQHGVDGVAFQCPLAGTQLIEQRFQHVGQAGDRIDADGAGAALDRGGGAEHRIDDLRVLLPRFQGQQASLHRVEAFAALLEEGGVEALQVHAHGSGGPEAKKGSGAGRSAQHFLHGGDQLFRIERLDQPAGGTGGLAFGLLVGGRLGGQHQQRGELVVRQLAQFADQRDAVHVRHVDVGDHRIEALALGATERDRAVFSFFDGKTGRGEGEGNHLAHRRRIVVMGCVQAQGLGDAQQARGVTEGCSATVEAGAQACLAAGLHERTQHLYGGGVDAGDLACIQGQLAGLRHQRGEAVLELGAALDAEILTQFDSAHRCSGQTVP
ncbi:hypothetical protein G6F57_015206 [Rhizopus arrhizus]|nr:hypothetical protein G6F57_015206 [Rhizopus arrhizus]